MQSLYLCSAALFALLASARGADYSLKNPAAEDPRIQKQQPFHWGTPPPGHRVKLGFVPIKVLASVRHEKSTKFVPRREALSEATTPEEIVLAKRLKEAITTKKLGEVYTEQGYEDQNYDHGHFEKHGDFKENFQNRDKKEHKSEHADSSGDQDTHATVDVPETKAAVDVVKYPFYLNAPENSAKRSPLWSNLWEWARNKIQVTVNISNNRVEWNPGHYCFFIFCSPRGKKAEGQKIADAVERGREKEASETISSAAPVALSYEPPAAIAVRSDQYYPANAAWPPLQWIVPQPQNT